jgi:hypothetical protein
MTGLLVTGKIIHPDNHQPKKILKDIFRERIFSKILNGWYRLSRVSAAFGKKYYNKLIRIAPGKK